MFFAKPSHENLNSKVSFTDTVIRRSSYHCAECADMDKNPERGHRKEHWSPPHTAHTKYRSEVYHLKSGNSKIPGSHKYGREFAVNSFGGKTYQERMKNNLRYLKITLGSIHLLHLVGKNFYGKKPKLDPVSCAHLGTKQHVGWAPVGIVSGREQITLPQLLPTYDTIINIQHHLLKLTSSPSRIS